ncbi:multicopper oxidase family protein [Sphaerimonospora sp. CA-214678]|uniref:multicopper oxidase family protein n=1 Tax=Sphaerimonospora sp. CA-214678 TaxID=3240029 RepID=UPI003D8CF775
MRPDSPAVLDAEKRRQQAGGRVVRVNLAPRVSAIDIGSGAVSTWAYDGELPGKEIRVTAGDRLRVELSNQLPAPTTIHWHGLALRNDMDGAEVTQRPVDPGSTFTYDFIVPDGGTYWFHPHVGMQLDRGLYAPLIVEPRDEPGGYDHDWVIVLDDWLDGVSTTPDDQLRKLQSGGMDHDMGGMSMEMPSSPLLGGDAGDVIYPYYLLNGRTARAPRVFTAKPGQKARIRLINAGADTAFRVALAGHRLTVTHSDGFPVRPVPADALLIGMGERYDLVVTLGDGVFPLYAQAEGKKGQAMALVRTGAGQAPDATVRVPELNRRVLQVGDLDAASEVFLADKTPDTTHTLALGGDMKSYRWTINGRLYDPEETLPVRQGERVRLRFTNGTTMFHPMHLHGHTFQVRWANGRGPRKDTIIVKPKETITADFVADNPGQWMIHCHNAYHQGSGMMTTLSYMG